MPGVSAVDVAVLSFLPDPDGGERLSALALARRLDTPLPTVVRSLVKLQDAGLVAWTDRWVKTDEGNAMVRGVFPGESCWLTGFRKLAPRRSSFKVVPPFPSLAFGSASRLSRRYRAPTNQPQEPPRRTP